MLERLRQTESWTMSRALIDSNLALQVISTLFALQILGIAVSGVIIGIKFLRKPKSQIATCQIQGRYSLSIY